MQNFILVLTFILLMSCGNMDHQVPEIDYSNTTEIERKDAVSDITSFRMKRGGDVVDHLYGQALLQDSKLKELDDRIKKLGHFEKDSLRVVEEYISYSESYYAALERRFGAIRDTTSRQAIRKFMEDSKARFQERIVGHKSLQARNQNLQVSMADQYQIMKLLISENLVRSYQANTPSTQSLEKVNDYYEETIDLSKKYTKQLE